MKNLAIAFAAIGGCIVGVVGAGLLVGFCWLAVESARAGGFFGVFFLLFTIGLCGAGATGLAINVLEQALTEAADTTRENIQKEADSANNDKEP